MADPMAGYRVSGPDPQPLALDPETESDQESDLSLVALGYSSDLDGYTERPEPSSPSLFDQESALEFTSNLHGFLVLSLPDQEESDICQADRMSAYNIARLLPAAASSDLRRRLFGGRRRRRRVGLPLPIHRTTTLSDGICRNARAVPIVDLILDDIVHYTLSTLHDIQKSLLYWESMAEGTNLQQMYFMIFERGPRAFLETTWQTLTGLRSRSPSQYLLNSAAIMVSTKIDALTGMQNCLAAFLAEVYSAVDRRKEILTEVEWSAESPCVLLNILNPLFSELELSLRTLVVKQTASFTQPIFQTLPGGDYDNSTAVKYIYQNLVMIDILISNKLAVHQKLRNKTRYWLPYTCGAIGLSACSLWLLRHSSFMGSSDTDGSIRDAKESVARYWDQHAVELIISIRDGLYRTFKRANQLTSTKQDAHQIEASLHRCEKELMHLPQRTPSRELALPMPTNEIQNYPHDLQKKLLELDRSLKEKKLGQQEALRELTQILEGNEIKFALCAAWPGFGLCLLLLLVLRTSFFHDQDEEERDKMSRLPQRLLLRDAELRLMEFQKCTTIGRKGMANSKFGFVRP